MEKEKTFMRLTIAVLSLAVMQAQLSGPAQLLQQAKELLQQPEKGKAAIPIPRTANQQWQSLASNDPSYAESLDLYVELVKNKQSDSAADLKTMARRAVQIEEVHQETQPATMALALEIEADLLGRTDARAADWGRATALRAQHIESLFPLPNTKAAEEEVLIKPSSGMSMPVLASQQEPEYTLVARLAKLEGTVLLSVTINQTGEPQHIRLRRGCGYGLDEKAAEAVNRWRFRPATKQGEAVPMAAQIEVNFRLLENAPTSSKRLTTN